MYTQHFKLKAENLLILQLSLLLYTSRKEIYLGLKEFNLYKTTSQHQYYKRIKDILLSHFEFNYFLLFQILVTDKGQDAATKTSQ